MDVRVLGWRLMGIQVPSERVMEHAYASAGPASGTYVVDWISGDDENPTTFPQWKKWLIAVLAAMTTVAVTLASSAYTGGLMQIMDEFGASEEVATLGVSLYVLGFAIGPLFWAPLSEFYGRQSLLFISFGCFTAFNAGCTGAKKIQTLLILRFLAGSFGSSALTNSGGVIADMFDASERGLAMILFSAAPSLGPVLGPIIGGFLGMNCGWRWVEGLMAIFSGVVWIIVTLSIPETYTPVLLRRRAAYLSNKKAKVYRSKLELNTPDMKLGEVIKTSLSRPWTLLFTEPIVFLLSLYMAIIYGTLYMLFAAYPIVYQQTRGWSDGVGGLAFLGLVVGFIPAIIYAIPDNKGYARVLAKSGGRPQPEYRLRVCMVGGISLTIGLFWFAWTDSPDIHWLASVAAGAPFGFGSMLIFMSIFNYLVDSYTKYAASVLAANSVLRSLFGCIFPLFTTYMFNNLGIHWAASIPAFLSLACIPLPFIFFVYGKRIRARCKYTAESAAFIEQLLERKKVELEEEPSCN